MGAGNVSLATGALGTETMPSSPDHGALVILIKLEVDWIPQRCVKGAK
jgi:hypothetical protein